MNYTLSIMQSSLSHSIPYFHYVFHFYPSLCLIPFINKYPHVNNKFLQKENPIPFPNNYSESRLWTWPHTQWQTSRCHGSIKLSPHPRWDRLVQSWPPGDWATLSLGSISHPDFLSCQDYISNYNLTRSKWTPMHPSDWKASGRDVKGPPLINNTSGRISSIQIWMKSDGLKAQSY